MTVPFLDLRAQNEPLRDEINEAIRQVIDSSAFAGGPFVAKFEEEFAAFCGSRYAVGVSNGTDALWLSLLALGVGPGDEVITVPSTFMATAEAITYTGAKPVFVDIDEVTYTMDVEALQDAITHRTKVIIPVHLFGQIADMDAILEIARARGIAVIEDACQAHGAEYKNRRAGTMSDAGCFSFYPGKNLGAMGEAGAVITDREDLATKLRILRDHGQVRKYAHTMVGWNSRMDGIQGAVLGVKLRHLEKANDCRRSNAARYNERLSGAPEIITPIEAAGRKHVYHVYAVRVQNRERVQKALDSAGIGWGIHYPIPVHLQEAYADLGLSTGSFPVAEKCADQFLSLPMYPELTMAQIDKVVDAVLKTAEVTV